ncbi:MAG: DUF5343 domain-containing protein [Pseudorhodoplanes sp.]|nr:DUF5343 domain-containing protein [Pseudorhodoplanes sp.]
MSVLPYVTATGNVERALLAIKSAATPEKVTQDFVKTILKISGGSGNQMNSLLKKLGFVNADGTPSDIYKRFRNNASTGAAAADALRAGYAPLFKRNEFWHALPDDQLRGLIIEETGQGEDSPVVTMTLNTIKGIKKFANFDKVESDTKTVLPAGELPSLPAAPPMPAMQANTLGLNLGYTINLNLPATSDIAVFNAIFKSLKVNLLKGTDENG